MRLLITFFLIAMVAAANARVEVPLTVKNHAGISLNKAPARGGIPFAKGVLQDGAGIKLIDEAGKNLPCQARTIARWYDGSVKWLLVDSQVDLPVAGELKLTLLPGEKQVTSKDN
ncbi:hypothetical protein ACFLQL_02740, partial [Verrucomicrobiota bacterium]